MREGFETKAAWTISVGGAVFSAAIIAWIVWSGARA
jgi:hypothetical protein